MEMHFAPSWALLRKCHFAGLRCMFVPAVFCCFALCLCACSWGTNRPRPSGTSLCADKARELANQLEARRDKKAWQRLATGLYDALQSYDSSHRQSTSVSPSAGGTAISVPSIASSGKVDSGQRYKDIHTDFLSQIRSFRKRSKITEFTQAAPDRAASRLGLPAVEAQPKAAAPSNNGNRAVSKTRNAAPESKPTSASPPVSPAPAASPVKAKEKEREPVVVVKEDDTAMKDHSRAMLSQTPPSASTAQTPQGKPDHSSIRLEALIIFVLCAFFFIAAIFRIDRDYRKSR